METIGRKVVELSIDDVLPNRFQPRIKFNEEAINELSKSIQEHGVIQPIVVRPIGDKFEIIAGERRYKASCMANLKTIPAIITDLNDKDSAEVALIENVQRENLTPIEEAISYKKILDMGYITQEALAVKLGKTQSTIANKLRLLNLDDEVQEALLKEKISERHARSLLKLTNKEEQRMMLKRIISERLPVRKTDEEIEKLLNGENKDMLNTNQESNLEVNSENIEQEQPKFKFINTVNEPEELEEDIKPSKFFNILDEEEKNEPKEEENFSNIFINPFITEPKTNSNNNLLEELAEIENSINNSNKKIEQEINKEKEEEIEEFEFIEEDEFEEQEQIKEEQIEEPVIKEEQRINNFKDVLQSIRKCSDKIEQAGYVIDTEEYDLDGVYQVVFKITKE